jgi:uncharacterized damage-inducible protein DinB
MTTIAETLLPEFDQEMSATRKLLERVPESLADWKPHQKSRSLGDLATHVANIPAMMRVVIKQDELISPDPSVRPPKFTTTAALVEFFDKNVKIAREALTGVPDSRMALPWTLKFGDKTIFTRPRSAVVRSFVISHHIHHRGQLGVYLRLQDVALPSAYGPTADESF